MKLFYAKETGSLSVIITLYELGISCGFEAVDLITGKTEKGEDFTRINPKGEVPTLILDEKQVLTGEETIQYYICDEYRAFHLLPEVGNFKRYEIIEWLNFMSSDLHGGHGILFDPRISTRMKNRIFRPRLENKLSFLDAYLKDSPYLVGEDFSLADGNLFSILYWLPNFKVKITRWHYLSHYFINLKKRKSMTDILKEFDI